MRVMVLGLRGFPNVQGGIEKHAENLYPLLVELGCCIDVVARSSYVPRHQRSWNGVTMHRIWAPRIAGAEALVHSVCGVIYAAIKRPDLLHIHGIGPALVTPLAKLFHLRVVVTHHGPDYDRERWSYLARWLLRLGENLGMRYSMRTIAVSKVICDLVKRKYDVDATLIPNGVALPELPTDDHVLRKFHLDRKRYILLVSRFVQEKRHLDLINAFEKACLVGWKLVLVGDADHPDQYSRRIRTIAARIPNIVLTGLQSGSSLAELYANAGLFILPSSHEGLPIAMLEAMSYGLPVYASDIPANLEVGLPSDNYFPLGNVEYLSNLIKAFVNVKSLSADMHNYRALIRDRYDWREIAKKTLVVYQSVLKKV